MEEGEIDEDIESVDTVCEKQSVVGAQELAPENPQTGQEATKLQRSAENFRFMLPAYANTMKSQNVLDFLFSAKSICAEVVALRNENTRLRQDLGEERREHERTEQALRTENAQLKQELDTERKKRQQTERAVGQIQKVVAGLCA